MSNNCCGTDFVDGGTWKETTLINANIVEPIIKSASMEGGVSLDDATAQDIADQICGKLSGCIQEYVDNGTFENVTLNKAKLMSSTLTNVIFDGTVNISDAAKEAFKTQLCEVFKPCVIKHIQDSKLEKLDAENVTLKDVELSGLIKATVDSAKGIAEIVGPYLAEHVVKHVENSKFDSLTASNVKLTNTDLRGTLELSKDASDAIYSAIETSITLNVRGIVSEALKMLKPSDIGAVDAAKPLLVNPTITGGTATNIEVQGGKLSNVSGTNISIDVGRLKNMTLAGQIPLDTEAKEHLCKQLTDCIIGIMDDAFSQQDVAAVFADCDGAPRSPGTRIVSCSDLKNALALTEQKIINQMPISDVITGLTYDGTAHKIVLETTLSGGQPQKWEIALDELGGQVVADNVTIGGTGTTKDPLHVILEESDSRPVETNETWLSTKVMGNREVLLGTDTFLEIDGMLIPAYRKA